MHILQSFGGESETFIDIAGPNELRTVCYATGPDESAGEFVNTFSHRFGDGGETFDPCLDGIDFMQRLRRDHPRKGDGWCQPAVGGFITHTTVTRGGFDASNIHEWPDFVGQPINAEKAGLSLMG